MTNATLLPILKWAGGKRKLSSKIIQHIPKDHNTYIEPFLGGGAVLLALQPNKAIVNDANTELINVYNTVKTSPEDLIENLRKHEKQHSKEYYYKIRELDRTPSYKDLENIEKAGRFLYLNKTGYNGLYRVNRKGENNVPYGKYEKPNIVNEIAIRQLSDYLQTNEIQITSTDYQEPLKKAKPGDFVYLDPPYAPLSATSSFTNYTSEGFNLEKQIELRDQCLRLRDKGVRFIQSNSNTPIVHELYKGFRIELVDMGRSINSKPDNRGNLKEALIHG